LAAVASRNQMTTTTTMGNFFSPQNPFVSFWFNFFVGRVFLINVDIRYTKVGFIRSLRCCGIKAAPDDVSTLWCHYKLLLFNCACR
jgi:hypothetical protein